MTREQIQATEPSDEADPEAHERPWERLDPGLTRALSPELPAMAAEIIDEIARAIPEYRRPLGGSFGRGLRDGVQDALRQFVELIGRPGTQQPLAHATYAGLGRGELRAGRSLDSLQAAYRVGARVAWRRVSGAARAAGADAATVSLLAESIFAYIDEISAHSVDGYVQAQALVAGEQQRRRQRLVRVLVDPLRPDDGVLPAAALDAGWSLPRALAAMAVRDEDVERVTRRLGAGAIGGRVGELTCVLLPDPDGPGRREQLARALGNASAALGPTVAAPQAHVSFARASEGLRLLEAGLLAGEGLVLVEEHLATLVLFGDRALLDDLARRRLAPLDELADGARERLAETLAAWLRRQGSVPAVAEDLHVHRQTVRYRLTRLRELFGAELEDPDARFELELALRAMAAHESAGGDGTTVEGSAA